MTGAQGNDAAQTKREVVVWRFLDGRAGHENQTLGLCRALGSRLPVAVHDVQPRHTGMRALADWMLGSSADGATLPDPQLLLAAGHATHLPMLAAARARGGRRVLMMRPSLPLWLFDLCLVPAHDGLEEGPRVLNTRGAVNAVRPAIEKDDGIALVLLGGPSAHCRWAESEVVRQVLAVVNADTASQWIIAGSPRTPPSTLKAMEGRLPVGAELVPFANAAPGWLADRLAVAGRAWVSQDSVSMVYESLTAGAATGLIELPLARGSRVQRGVAELVSGGLLTTWSAWRAGRPLTPPCERLSEAERCADRVIEQWFSNR